MKMHLGDKVKLLSYDIMIWLCSWSLSLSLVSDMWQKKHLHYMENYRLRWKLYFISFFKETWVKNL